MEERQQPPEATTPLDAQLQAIEKTCPHCGMNTDTPKVDVTEADKDLWLRYIMSRGNQRFTREFSVYGGRIKFTLRTRTTTEEKDVDIGLAEVIKSLADIADFNKVKMEALKLQLVYSLDALSTDGASSPDEVQAVYGTTYPTADIQAGWAAGKSVCAKKYDALADSLSQHVLTLMVDKLVDFNTLCAALTIRGLSENF